MACPMTAGSSGRVSRFVELAGKELASLIKERIDNEVRDKVKEYTDKLVFDIVTQEMAKYAINLDSVMSVQKFEQNVRLTVEYIDRQETKSEAK